MKFSELEQAQNVLVYGFGVEGQSTFTFLQKNFPTIKVEIFDDHAALNHPNFKKRPLESYDALFVSPGINRDRFTEKVQQKITSQGEVFFANISEEKRKKVIGISGTKGKTTTTKFCLELLQHAGKKVQVGGNYGVPLLDILDDFLKDKFEYVVCELSSYQLENLKKSPGISIFLNIFPEHLDRHKGYENYIEAKKNLWRYQKEDDFVIAPQKMIPLIQTIKPNNIFIAQTMPKEYFSKNSIFQADHFRENFGTMIELAHLLDIPDTVLQKTAQQFKGAPHRLEFVTKKEGVLFFNDSISTNPHSTYSALRYFKDKLGSLIVGGKDRGLDYNILYQGIVSCSPQAHIFILNTETAPKITAVFQQNKFTNYSLVPDLQEAVRMAFYKTGKNKVCLLSPAASSFDRFKNYIERGNIFKRAIGEY